MRRGFLIVILCAVTLAGCSTAPQSREVGSTAVVSVLAVQQTRRDLTVFAAAEGRAGGKPSFYEGKGDAPAAAIEDLTDSGDKVASTAHVEHVVLARSAAGRLDEVLSCAFQDPSQSTESQLWLLRADRLDEVFADGEDPAKRLAVLKAAGKEGWGFRPLTLREAAAKQAAGNALLIPALEQKEEGLSFAGFALWHGGEVLGWLQDESALGAALLLGEELHWTMSVGERSLSLQNTDCRVAPVWDGDRLTGLQVTCDLEGLRTGGWTGKPKDEKILAAQTEQAIKTAFAAMQKAGADGACLRQQAGMAQRWKWDTLSDQWEAAFPTLTLDVSVRITTAERY